MDVPFEHLLSWVRDAGQNMFDRALVFMESETHFMHENTSDQQRIISTLKKSFSDTLVVMSVNVVRVV